MTDKPLVTREPLDLSRKVAAILRLFLGGVALLLVLVAVQAALLPEAEALGDLIDLVTKALGGLATALVAAYATRDRAL